MYIDSRLTAINYLVYLGTRRVSSLDERCSAMITIHRAHGLGNFASRVGALCQPVADIIL